MIETSLTQTLVLTPKLRRELKNPLGILIRGSPKETMKKLSEIINKEKPECIISVGDVVSQNMLQGNFETHLAIVDNRVMRDKVKPIKAMHKKKVTIKNPAGTVTPETWTVVEQALKQRQSTQIIIEGEEDLLTLVAVLKAPDNALVVYGQPHEGIVVVKSDKTAKDRVLRIVEAMKPLPKS